MQHAPLAAPRATQAILTVLLVSRPALWVNTVGVGVVGLWLAGTLWSWDARWLTLLAWLTLPYNLLIYGLNDITDRPEDALNTRKGGWQGARITRDDVPVVLRGALALNAPFLGFFLLTFPPEAMIVLLLAAVLFALYSLPPVRFKGRPFVDSLSNVAYALPVVAPALVLGAPVPWLALAALAAWSVGKHAFDAVQDISPDRAARVRTTATTLGPRGTAHWCAAWFLVAGACLWPLSVISALSVWGVSGGLALLLYRRPSEATARALYPASLLSPWLLGGIAGVQLVYTLSRAATLP